MQSCVARLCSTVYHKLPLDNIFRHRPRSPSPPLCPAKDTRTDSRSLRIPVVLRAGRPHWPKCPATIRSNAGFIILGLLFLCLYLSVSIPLSLGLPRLLFWQRRPGSRHKGALSRPRTLARRRPLLLHDRLQLIHELFPLTNIHDYLRFAISPEMYL